MSQAAGVTAPEPTFAIRLSCRLLTTPRDATSLTATTFDACHYNRPNFLVWRHGALVEPRDVPELAAHGRLDDPSAGRPTGCVVVSLTDVTPPASSMVWDGVEAHVATGDLAGTLWLDCDHSNCPTWQRPSPSGTITTDPVYTDSLATMYDLQNIAQFPVGATTG